MRKAITLAMTLAVAMCFSQCKKNVETLSTAAGDGVRISLSVDGGKHDVFPTTGAVVYGNGDVIYVGHNGKYVGSLTYANGTFSGTIYPESEADDYLHFYFTGGKTPETAPTAGATESFTVSIADQSSKLPVLSYGHSTAKYSSETKAYSATLLNKCGLVKFAPATATSETVTVGGMKTEATINFATPGITPTATTGTITLNPVSDDAKWAILLQQDAVENPTVTISGYTCSIAGGVPAITENVYLKDGLSITMAVGATVTTTAVSSITTTTASSGGNVTSEGGGTVTAKGVCWSISENPTISDSKTEDGTGTGSFTSSITGLTAGTTYHVRAYATNQAGTTYGADVSFTAYKAPEVTTSAVTSIASTGATLNGNLTYAGVPTITEKGFVYSSSNSTPTTSDTKVTVSGTDTGTYTYSATGLTMSTTYYVRAYAINAVSETPVYGDVQSFTTLSIDAPTVTTTSVTIYNNGGAQMGGNVTSNGGETLTARGIVYSTSNSTPTLGGSGCTTQVVSGTGTGSYKYNVEGLTANTIYYVRAYATNSAGTSYGSVVSFTTTNETTSTVTTNTGALFTVASGTRVYFAKGNLVKTGASTYAFESTQYTVHTNKPLLFGYPRYYFTWSEIASSSNNPVSFTIGGSTYKTLTSAQWQYVLGLDGSARGGTSVSASGHFYAKAVVNGINGLILLPDNWSDSYYTLSNYNTTGAAFSGNTITSDQWATLESKGCVFLPMAGLSYGSSVDGASTHGRYWSCTEYSSTYAYSLVFDSSGVDMYYYFYETIGQSVRLVRFE